MHVDVPAPIEAANSIFKSLEGAVKALAVWRKRSRR